MSSAGGRNPQLGRGGLVREDGAAAAAAGWAKAAAAGGKGGGGECGSESGGGGCGGAGSTAGVAPLVQVALLVVAAVDVPITPVREPGEGGGVTRSAAA